MCEELRADLCQIKNEHKETQNQVYLLEATIRKLREDNFEAEMLQVELKSERDLALEQAKNAQVNTCAPWYCAKCQHRGGLGETAFSFLKGAR